GVSEVWNRAQRCFSGSTKEGYAIPCTGALPPRGKRGWTAPVSTRRTIESEANWLATGGGDGKATGTATGIATGIGAGCGLVPVRTMVSFGEGVAFCRAAAVPRSPDEVSVRGRCPGVDGPERPDQPEAAPGVRSLLEGDCGPESFDDGPGAGISASGGGPMGAAVHGSRA